MPTQEKKSAHAKHAAHATSHKTTGHDALKHARGGVGKDAAACESCGPAKSGPGKGKR